MSRTLRKVENKVVDLMDTPEEFIVVAVVCSITVLNIFIGQ